jgi:hypothetical protein
MTKCFTQQPLDAISGHRIADLPTDRQANTRMPASILPDKEEQMRAMSLFSLGKNLRKLVFVPKAVALGKTRGLTDVHGFNYDLLARNGNRKILPALGTAAFKDHLAIGGLHSLAKTMGSLAPDFARLVSTFH